jgi:hypothetical protein
MKCYEQLGMDEHARKDYINVLNADPSYISRAIKEGRK